VFGRDILRYKTIAAAKLRIAKIAIATDESVASYATIASNGLKDARSRVEAIVVFRRPKKILIIASL
jgi:hypothetical protein